MPVRQAPARAVSPKAWAPCGLPWPEVVPTHERRWGAGRAELSQQAKRSRPVPLFATDSAKPSHTFPRARCTRNRRRRPRAGVNRAGRAESPGRCRVPRVISAGTVEAIAAGRGAHSKRTWRAGFRRFGACPSRRGPRTQPSCARHFLGFRGHRSRRPSGGGPTDGATASRAKQPEPVAGTPDPKGAREARRSCRVRGDVGGSA